MSDDLKNLVSGESEPEKRNENQGRTVAFEKILDDICRVTAAKSFTVNSAEYWEGWRIFLHENLFIRLYLDQSLARKITDEQVQHHYEQLNKFLEQLEDMERSGLYNQKDYPGLHTADAKHALADAFQRLKDKSGRDQYIRELDTLRFEAGKSKLMPFINRAFDDGDLETSEEEMLMEMGRANNLSDRETRDLLEEVLRNNPQFKRVDTASVIDDKVKLAVAEEIAALKSSAAPKRVSPLVWVGAVAVLLFIIIYIPIYREGEAWDSAKKENTESAYIRYAAEYPAGKHYAEAMRLKEEVSWEETKKRNSEEGYNAYLTQFPNGQYKPQAMEFREPLMWARVQRENSEGGYSDYMQKYPSGKYYWVAKRQYEPMMWQRVQNENTKYGFRDFLSKFPGSKNEGDARSAIERIEFDEAKNANSIAAMESFLGSYPNSRFGSEAKSLLENLKAADGESTVTEQPVVNQKLLLVKEYCDYIHAKEADNATNCFLPAKREKIYPFVNKICKYVEYYHISNIVEERNDGYTAYITAVVRLKYKGTREELWTTTYNMELYNGRWYIASSGGARQ